MTVQVTDKRGKEKEVTLEGKNLQDVQKEKFQKTAKVADEISSAQSNVEKKPLSDKHYSDLSSFRFRIEEIERQHQILNKEAYEYAKNIVAEYFPGETEARISLLDRAIYLEKK